VIRAHANDDIAGRLDARNQPDHRRQPRVSPAAQPAVR
jgi:hypothetical protein